jgi:hypothetical protein
MSKNPDEFSEDRVSLSSKGIDNSKQLGSVLENSKQHFADMADPQESQDVAQECNLHSKMTKEIGTKESIDLNDTVMRYAGYTAGFARLFRYAKYAKFPTRYSRYLAFSSDFGHALEPVISERIAKGLYTVTIGYCIADVAWEAYKLQERGFVTEQNVPMSMTQCVVERATMQAISSVTLPSIIIHTSISLGTTLTAKIGRFRKWGPVVAGLVMIPVMPLYLDHHIGTVLYLLLLCLVMSKLLFSFFVICLVSVTLNYRESCGLPVREVRSVEAIIGHSQCSDSTVWRLWIER